jgi:hypothetical protein
MTLERTVHYTGNMIWIMGREAAVVVRPSTRCIHIAGVTHAPNGALMKQVARTLIDVDDGFLLDKGFLILDRDTKYTDAFRDHPDREGVKPVRWQGGRMGQGGCHVRVTASITAQARFRSPVEVS